MKDTQNDDEKTLYLAWVLGEARFFARMLPKVAHKATLSDTGVLLDTRGRPWHDQGLPSAAVGEHYPIHCSLPLNIEVGLL
jgi:hypothetical protein